MSSDLRSFFALPNVILPALIFVGCGPLARPSGQTAVGAEGTEVATAEEEDAPLSDRQEVPGTSASLRPPIGSVAMNVGSGFIHAARRLQILVVASEGADEVHHRVYEGLLGDAELEEEVEVTLSGQDATIIVDRQEQNGLTLERVWTFVRIGTRSVGVIGAYDSERSETLRPLVKASIASLEINREVALNPEVALGAALSIPDSLRLRTDSTGNMVVYHGHTGEGVPEPGDPVLFLASVPVGSIPAAQRATLCNQILEQIGPIPAAAIDARAVITSESLSGCEVTGHQEQPSATGEAIPTDVFAALVFQGDAAFLIAGLSPTAQTQWQPLYRQSATSLRLLRGASEEAALPESE